MQHRVRGVAKEWLLCGLAVSVAGWAQEVPTPMPPPAATTGAAPVPRPRPPRIVRPGVNLPGVSHSLDEVQKQAVFLVEGTPDWSVVTSDAVWVTSARANHVVQLLASSNTVGIVADVQRPCSGLAAGFGSIWVPSCGTHQVLRLNPASGKATASISADPANSEGGIAVGAGSVWFVTKPSKLLRIDPKTDSIAATIELPSGSDNPLFADGFVWVSSFEHDLLLKVDPRTNSVVASTPVGPKPRFLTAGAGSVWTLNQGDGSVTRYDMSTGKVVATIACGLPGSGGEISFGEGNVWATMFDFPLTRIDPNTNTVTGQWKGEGGDGVRVGLGSVWLSNLRQGTVWRIAAR